MQIYASNYAEPLVAWAVFHIPSHPLIYKSFDQTPYTIFAYNPIYAYLSYLVSLITGQNFICGRLISLIAFLFILFFVFKILKQFKLPSGLGLFLAFWACFSPILMKHAVDFRPDMLGLSFTILGIYFSLRWYNEAIDRTSRHTFLALLFFTLAFFTRQNYIFAPGAFILFLLAKRLPKQALFFANFQFFLFIMPIFFLNHITEGAYFKNVILFNMNQYSSKLAFDSWMNHVPYLLPLIGIGFLFFIKRTTSKETNFFDFYFVSALFAGFMSGRVGSDSNYFLETNLATTLYFCVILKRYLLPDSLKWPRFLVWAFFTLSLIIFVAPTFRNSSLKPREERELNEVVTVLGRLRGKILSEDIGILMVAGKEVLYQPFEFAQLSRRKLWDENKILERIKNQEFETLVVSTNIYAYKETSRFTPRMIIQIRESYKTHGVLHGFLFLIPKKINKP